MTEGTSSLVGGSRMSKRRRLEESTREERPAQSSSDAYREDWKEETQEHITGSQDAGYYGETRAEYNNAAAGSSITATESSSWQQPDSSAYPDLAAGFQQPYFYPQTGRSNYNTAWTPTDSQAYGSGTAIPASYSTGEPSNTVTMPYFPPTTPGTAQPVEAIDALDGATALNYLDVAHAPQYAYNGKVVDTV